MKTRTPWILGWLLPAVLVACATDHPKSAATAGKVTPQMRSGSNELRNYQLLEWIAPDDRITDDRSEPPAPPRSRPRARR